MLHMLHPFLPFSFSFFLFNGAVAQRTCNVMQRPVNARALLLSVSPAGSARTNTALHRQADRSKGANARCMSELIVIPGEWFSSLPSRASAVGFPHVCVCVCVTSTWGLMVVYGCQARSSRMCVSDNRDRIVQRFSIHAIRPRIPLEARE